MGRGELFLGNMGLETLALATFSSFQVQKIINLEIERYENQEISKPAVNLFWKHWLLWLWPLLSDPQV